MNGDGFLGILMLDTRFERIVGDAGNPLSYDIPAKTRIVESAGSLDIVKDGCPDQGLVQAFVAAAQALEAEGAIAIISTCGFLISLQDHISKTVSVPVMLSGLSMFSQVSNMFCGRPIGILTASAQSLGPLTLAAAGIDADQVNVRGLEDCPAFTAAILRPKAQQLQKLDTDAISAAVVARAVDLCRETPELAAFVLECGNLPPYAEAITKATGRPVFSILDGARLMCARI